MPATPVWRPRADCYREPPGSSGGALGSTAPCMTTAVRERACLVNGRLDLENCANGGARVRLTVPVAAQETHA